MILYSEFGHKGCQFLTHEAILNALIKYTYIQIMIWILLDAHNAQSLLKIPFRPLADQAVAFKPGLLKGWPPQRKTQTGNRTSTVRQVQTPPHVYPT